VAISLLLYCKILLLLFLFRFCFELVVVVFVVVVVVSVAVAVAPCEMNVGCHRVRCMLLISSNIELASAATSAAALQRLPSRSAL